MKKEALLLILLIALSSCSMIKEDKIKSDAQIVGNVVRDLAEKAEDKIDEVISESTTSTTIQSTTSTTQPKQIPTECGTFLDNENIMLGMPSSDNILERQAYVISHNSDTKQANWASYHLTVEYLTADAKRSDKFKADPDVAEGSRAELGDYSRSGFDRGHIVPSADMLRSQSINDESFYLSNMAPQSPQFNRGIWKELEEDVRDWARARESLWVISGPIFSEGFDTIGDNEVGVPQRFFKIIISEEGDCDYDSIAFIFPNEKGENEMGDYIVSIDEIEAETGLDFLDLLEDSVEDSLEDSTAVGLWN